MEKIDFKKEMKQLYNPSTKEVTAVDVPPMNFLMIHGQGDPNTSPQYSAAIEALFNVSYTLKFMVKKKKGIDYAVMPLEGLWWVDDMTKFSTDKKDEWKWTSMIMQPSYVTEAAVTEAIQQVTKKKKLESLRLVRFESFREGLSAQIMHIGPYSAEGPNIAKIHDFIIKSGHALTGKHHEIYLSDPRKTAPQKMKTVLRQPMN
jgi:hypothetical protein